MKTPIRSLLLLLVLTFIAGCGSSPGPDSISSRKPQSPGALPDCVVCHSSVTFTRRQIYGAGGDFGANTSLLSHHVAGASNPTSDQCLVCHDLSSHMFGTVRLKHADTGASIAYDPANPSSAEPFCLSCHDASGASTTFVSGGLALNPFADGSVLGNPPYPYARRIADSWAKQYGHGPNGNHSAEKRLTCLGTGQPGTGCHGNNGQINAHGSANEVLASRGFKYNIGDSYVESDYDLCFNCHANYVGFTREDILGVKFGGILDTNYSYLSGPRGYNPPYQPATGALVTNFADHNETGSPYNDSELFFGVPNMNLHWFHLGLPYAAARGDVAHSGRIVCVNCHDVHGSGTSYGAVYDEMGYVKYSPDGINWLGKMTDLAYNSTLLKNYPTYCAFNCHPVQGETKAWFYPITE